MRKGITQSNGAVRFDAKMLAILEGKGYKYVQVKSFTSDKRYDYLVPHFLLLVPLKELPADPRDKDIYEPIPSPILEEWAKESDDYFKIFIVHPG